MPRATRDQRGFAQHLRHDQTDCERRLWHHLRNRQLGGFKFRRQYPCPPYVLDFYCADCRLAVELDGGQHYDDEGRAKDRVRSEFLASRGIRVIRFGNHDVLGNFETVLEVIFEACREFAHSSAPSASNPRT
ncbi:endonuclease domain-containing protein [Pseudomonas indica]|uniref:endonuclease domain-containing protein n=1 Tax=Pseudomonas indica TaxID=137658 RepID=UPI0023F78306|nr:endonuclease domain-containing protein [Pseudomonas indica]MBU3057286.1 endonuclease domain-containing protein [Pseudomonas indica]